MQSHAMVKSNEFVVLKIPWLGIKKFLVNIMKKIEVDKINTPTRIKITYTSHDVYFSKAPIQKKMHIKHTKKAVYVSLPFWFVILILCF